jgi:hypothetical protein
LQRTIPRRQPDSQLATQSKPGRAGNRFLFFDAQEQVTAAKYHSDSILHTYSIINRGAPLSKLRGSRRHEAQPEENMKPPYVGCHGFDLGSGDCANPTAASRMAQG